MFSSLRPWAWRSKRAACAARGKQTCSGQTAWVRIERLTLRPFSYWKVRYSVGVGCQGGEIRLGGGEQFLDVLVKLELVIFNLKDASPGAVFARFRGKPRFSLPRQIRNGPFLASLNAGYTAVGFSLLPPERCSGDGNRGVTAARSVRPDRLVFPAAPESRFGSSPQLRADNPPADKGA